MDFPVHKRMLELLLDSENSIISQKMRRGGGVAEAGFGGAK